MALERRRGGANIRVNNFGKRDIGKSGQAV